MSTPEFTQPQSDRMTAPDNSYSPIPSAQPSTAPQPAPYSAEYVPTQAPLPPAQPERVGRGFALSLLAIPVGALLAGVIFALGFIAAVSTLAMAALAVFLYAKGSGGVVRKGIPAVLGTVVIGLLVCFMTIIGVDLFQAYQSFSTAEQAEYGSLSEFLAANLVNGRVWAAEGGNLAMMTLFGLLGVAGVVFRLVRGRRR